MNNETPMNRGLIIFDYEPESIFAKQVMDMMLAGKKDGTKIWFINVDKENIDFHRKLMELDEGELTFAVQHLIDDEAI